MFGSIEMRTEAHTLIGNFAQIGKAENLKAAGIGKNRMRPRHERMQPAKLPNQFMPRPKIKMISIAKNDFSAQFLKRLLRKPLHRRRSPDGHKSRRVNHAMRRSQTPKPRPTRISLQNFKAKSHPTNCNRSANRSGERPDPSNFGQNVNRPASH